ncbi:DUF4434 domain-containing protein [Marilutibacter maris]|nr:DUF4434 domain-containing protein [Lysobacter maris]
MKGLMLSLSFVGALASLPSAQAQTSKALSGAFTYFGYSGTNEVIPVSQLPAFLDELQELGNDTIIIAQTRATRAGQGCTYYATEFEWIKGFPGKLGNVLDEAQSRGMKVYVGTTLSSQQCPKFWESGNTRGVEEDVRTNIAVLANQYRSHPAFAGWYIPDEPGIPDLSKYNYYKRITSALKALAPGKPVIVAPYFPNQPNLPSPSSLADTAASFRSYTGVDIQAWQDGIGAIPGTKLFHWERPGYSSEQYYEALAAKLGAEALWADIEVFNYGTPLFNSAGLTGGYRAASARRINQQLWSARSAGKRVSWLHQWHMSELVGPANGYVEAPRLRGTYRGTYGIGGAHSLISLNHQNYTWLSAPSPTYPDSTGYELFDRRTGDPRNPQDSSWIGIPGAGGTARVRVDLGSAKTIDWIGVHTLSYPAWGIRSPVSADLYCGATTSSMTKVATLTAPFTAAAQDSVQEEEYVLGNRTPLNASCRYFELRAATGGNWVFLSEIELARD